MTTQHIPMVAQVAGQVASLGERTRARAEEVARDSAMLDQRRQDILLGAATAVQMIDDDRAVLDHERSQLDNIRNLASQLDDTPVVPPAPAPATPAPVQEPPTVLTPTPAPVPAPADPGLGILDPASADVPRHQTPTVVGRFRALSAGWKFFSVIMALVFALFGLWIAASWRLDGYVNQLWSFAPFNGVVTIAWFVGWTVLFFGIGGRLALWLAGKFNNNT